MNIAEFDVQMHIDYTAVQKEIEIIYLNSYANMWLMEYELHKLSGCPCTGEGHCTVLARRTGMRKKTYTNDMKKLVKKYKKLKLKQTLLRKRKTSKEFPIVIQ
jgi:hypothetical protein